MTDAKPVVLDHMRPIFEAVSRKYRIPVPLMLGPGKSQLQLEARQVCCWLAFKLTRLSPLAIGEAVGRGRTAAGQAKASIERLRADEPLVLSMTNALLAELQES